jgi:hypothetical protein
MPHMDTKRILEALKVLEDEGRKGYKPEYADGIPQWRAIGQAVAHATDSARNILDLAYTALEDHNYHSINAVIEWIFPLYEQVFHVSDLARLQKMIDKKSVTILTEWNKERADYDTKRVNVKLKIEEVTDSE